MEKNNSRVCRICDKRFSNGKAMGGHMRSHFAKLPIPPKPETKNQALDNSAELTQYPIQSASSLTDHSKKKPAQNFRSLKRNFFAFLANSNRGNESGSYPKNPTRKRSKCHRKIFAEAEPKQMNSIPETFHAEEAAWSLLMLSKDKWPESKEIKTHKMKEAIEREAKEDGENGGDDLLVQIHARARFKCEWCGKMFQSYQALGGHKANHKKKNPCQEGGDFEDDQSGNNSNVADQKAFECPYCYRVFKSAQALGGHKKVHFSNTKTATAHTSTNEFGGMLVDLNFPASGEDEEVTHGI
ncbi:Zinc finger C2H2-type [Sesbania bispinosa]|nr:Zinc finger C2H2-type [Sesbania bispinosa]